MLVVTLSTWNFLLKSSINSSTFIASLSPFLGGRTLLSSCYSCSISIYNLSIPGVLFVAANSKEMRQLLTAALPTVCSAVRLLFAQNLGGSYHFPIQSSTSGTVFFHWLGYKSISPRADSGLFLKASFCQTRLISADVEGLSTFNEWQQLLKLSPTRNEDIF